MVQATESRLAVLIDADNASAKNLRPIMDEIAKYGVPTVKHAYGDWTKLSKDWKDALLEVAAVPVQQYAYTKGKNATDAALIIDAMDILHDGNTDGFVIVSSDSDFTPLVLRLRETGKKVYGIREQKTPEPFRIACDKFIDVGDLVDGNQGAASAKTNAAPPASAARTAKKPLSAKTVNFIAQCIQEKADASGQCQLPDLKRHLKSKNPGFDHRSYGYSQISKLLRTVDRFEVGGESPRVWVKVKRAE